MNTNDLYTTVKSIDKAIADVAKNGMSLQLEMHKVACSVVAHVGKHKDSTVAVRMVQKFTEAMPEMARVNALKEWFNAYSAVTFSDDGSCCYSSSKPTKLGDAIAKPFWKFKKSEGAAYVALDLGKELESLIKKVQKDADKTGKDHSKLLTALKTVPVQPSANGFSKSLQ